MSNEHQSDLESRLNHAEAIVVRDYFVSPIEPITLGLSALALIGEKLDLREAIQSLALHYHSAGKCGFDVVVLFVQAANLAEKGLAEQMRNFPNRSPDSKSLASMGFVEAELIDGFGYKRTW